jgi:hypothetical protein
MRKAFTRPGRKSFASLAAIGLVLQLFLTGLYAPAMVFTSSAPVPDGARTVLICTGTGVKNVTLDARGQPTQPEPGDDKPGFCPICFGLAGGPALPAHPLDVAPDRTQVPLVLNGIAFAWPTNGLPSRPTARGPPA